MLMATFTGGVGGGAAQTEGGGEGQGEDYSFSQRLAAACAPKRLGTNVVSAAAQSADVHGPLLVPASSESYWEGCWKDCFLCASFPASSHLLSFAAPRLIFT